MLAARIKRPVFYGVALVLVVVGTTAAAVPGDPLKLGVVNSINALTTWSGSVADRLVQIQNTSTAAGARALQLFSQGPWSTAHIRNAGTGPALQLQVGAGRAPILVNADAGKATNLNVDKLDGQDSSAFLPATGKAADANLLDGQDSSTLARGTGVRVLSNRLVLPAGTDYPGVTLLELDGLGELRALCEGSFNGRTSTHIFWDSPPSTSLSYWSDKYSTDAGSLIPGSVVSAQIVAVAAHQAGQEQQGSTLLIGQGGYGLEAKTATITIGLYRSSADAACDVQATATIWTKP